MEAGAAAVMIQRFCAALLASALVLISTADDGIRAPGLQLPERVQVRLQTSDLRPGDIIFRRGTGVRSRVVLSASNDAEFSHVALVVRGGPDAAVVHAVPAEGPGERDGTKEESLTSFLSPARASRAALYRLDETTDASNQGALLVAAAAAENMAEQALPFDSTFDLNSSNSVYCTTLILRAYHAAGINLSVHTSNLPFGLKNVVLPMDLAASSSLKKVWDGAIDAGGLILVSH